MNAGPLLLCGTGGFATEVLAEFPDHFGAAYDPGSDSDMFEGLPVYRSLADVVGIGFHGATIAVGHPALARRVYGELVDAGLGLAPALVSPHSVITGSHVRLGEGTVIMAGAVLENHVCIGQTCIVSMNSTVGHHTELGDFVAVMPLSAVSGRVRLGDGCYLGSQVFVKEGVTIAPDSIIGAQAGVFRDIDDPGGTWVGSPARRLRPSAQDDSDP